MSTPAAAPPAPIGQPLTAEQYHADPCERPSLSATIASILCTRSPLHAWTAHPRLNPDFEREEKKEFDLGTVVHQLLLEGHIDSLAPIAADNFRTKAAQEARDDAYAAGKTPILTKDIPRVRAMVDAVRAQLAAHEADPPLFQDGQPERTLVWEEDGGVMCRARIDWLRDDLVTVDDLKTRGRSADPESCSRALFDHGYDVRAAFHLRGVERLTGRAPEFRWCFIETAPPYGLSVVSPGPDVLTIGQKKVEYALDLWRRCSASGEWPGYPRRVAYAELPAWEEARWLTIEEREAA